MLAPDGATGAADDPPMHEPGSRETALVEQGAVALVCDGQRYALGEGDCVTFDADLPHHFENPSGGGGGLVSGRRQRRSETELRRPAMPKTHVREDLGAPRGRPRAAVHRPAPGARGDEPAGLRWAAPGRAHGAPPRPHAGDGRSQHADRRDARGGAHQGRALARAGGNTGAQLRRVRRARVLARIRPSGDRARDRPRAGRDPAGHDDRVRGLAHLHARRVRRARVRNRHERGRARAGDAVHGPAQAALDAHRL